MLIVVVVSIYTIKKKGQKMKISKLFHWLYALLMLMPFIMLFGSFVSSIMSGTPIDVDTYYVEFASFVNNQLLVFDGIMGEKIFYVFEYLTILFVNQGGTIREVISCLLTYWTSISIIWLVFDTFLYVPLLAHRWLDKGVIE